MRTAMLNLAWAALALAVWGVEAGVHRRSSRSLGRRAKRMAAPRWDRAPDGTWVMTQGDDFDQGWGDSFEAGASSAEVYEYNAEVAYDDSPRSLSDAMEAESRLISESSRPSRKISKKVRFVGKRRGRGRKVRGGGGRGGSVTSGGRKRLRQRKTVRKTVRKSAAKASGGGMPIGEEANCREGTLKEGRKPKMVCWSDLAGGWADVSEDWCGRNEDEAICGRFAAVQTTAQPRPMPYSNALANFSSVAEARADGAGIHFRSDGSIWLDPAIYPAGSKFVTQLPPGFVSVGSANMPGSWEDAVNLSPASIIPPSTPLEPSTVAFPTTDSFTTASVTSVDPLAQPPPSQPAATATASRSSSLTQQTSGSAASRGAAQVPVFNLPSMTGMSGSSMGSLSSINSGMLGGAPTGGAGLMSGMPIPGVPGVAMSGVPSLTVPNMAGMTMQGSGAGLMSSAGRGSGTPAPIPTAGGRWVFVPDSEDPLAGGPAQEKPSTFQGTSLSSHTSQRAAAGASTFPGSSQTFKGLSAALSYPSSTSFSDAVSGLQFPSSSNSFGSMGSFGSLGSPGSLGNSLSSFGSNSLGSMGSFGSSLGSFGSSLNGGAGGFGSGSLGNSLSRMSSGMLGGAPAGGASLMGSGSSFSDWSSLSGGSPISVGDYQRLMSSPAQLQQSFLTGSPNSFQG